MKCICCRWYLATEGIFCEECAIGLTDREKQRFMNTFGGQCALLGLEVEKLKQAARVSLPRWLRRFV